MSRTPADMRQLLSGRNEKQAHTAYKKLEAEVDAGLASKDVATKEKAIRTYETREKPLQDAVSGTFHTGIDTRHTQKRSIRDAQVEQAKRDIEKQKGPPPAVSASGEHPGSSGIRLPKELQTIDSGSAARLWSRNTIIPKKSTAPDFPELPRRKTISPAVTQQTGGSAMSPVSPRKAPERKETAPPVKKPPTTHQPSQGTGQPLDPLASTNGTRLNSASTTGTPTGGIQPSPATKRS